MRPGFGLMEMAYTAWVTVHGIAMLRVTSLRGYPMDFERPTARRCRTSLVACRVPPEWDGAALFLT